MNYFTVFAVFNEALMASTNFKFYEKMYYYMFFVR